MNRTRQLHPVTLHSAELHRNGLVTGRFRHYCTIGPESFGTATRRHPAGPCAVWKIASSLFQRKRSVANTHALGDQDGWRVCPARRHPGNIRLLKRGSQFPATHVADFFPGFRVPWSLIPRKPQGKGNQTKPNPPNRRICPIARTQPQANAMHIHTSNPLRLLFFPLYNSPFWDPRTCVP